MDVNTSQDARSAGDGAYVTQAPTHTRSHRHWRVAGYALTVIMLLAGGVLLWQTQFRRTLPETPHATEPIHVAVSPITRQNLKTMATFSGEFRPYQEIDLYSQVAGFLTNISVDIGDRVTAGQILATLEIPELTDDLHKAQAELSRAMSERQRASAEYMDTHLLLERLQGVSKANPTLIPQQEIDSAAAKDREADANVISAKDQMDIAQAELDRLHTTTELCRIAAPFAGIVTKRFADPGSFIRGGISPSTPAMPLIRLSENRVERLIFPVPEIIASKVAVGTPVKIVIGSLARTIDSQVTRLTRHIDADTRTMDVEIDLKNDNLSIIPGMFASITLATGVSTDVLSAPITAVVQASGKSTVMIVDPNHHAHEQTVTVGLETPDYIEIVKGVAEGDLVVVGSRPEVGPDVTLAPEVVLLSSESKP